MTKLRKLVRALITPVGEDEVDVVMSTDALARDGHILLPGGCVLENYRANPIALWSHDPDKPVGNAETVSVGPDEITARVRFAPLGVSRIADETRGLVKGGVIRAVSVGFDPIDMEPLDPKRPKGGQRITQWELLEMSFVSVPADPGAVVTARANGEQDVAKTQIDPPGAPAAAPQTRAHDVRAKGLRGGKVVFERGLYSVASLCYLFESLGYAVDSAKYESAIEGDNSAVPGMLAAVLHDLGDALLAMTAEEVAEALAGYDVEPETEGDDDSVLVVEERAHIAAAASPAVRAFRRGYAHAKIRAGKALSADTVRCLREAQAFHEDAMAQHRSAIANHKKGVKAIDDMMGRAGVPEDSGDEADKTVQPSGGVEDEGGERMSADYRRRQADLLAFPAN